MYQHGREHARTRTHKSAQTMRTKRVQGFRQRRWRWRRSVRLLCSTFGGGGRAHRSKSSRNGRFSSSKTETLVRHGGERISLHAMFTIIIVITITIIVIIILCKWSTWRVTQYSDIKVSLYLVQSIRVRYYNTMYDVRYYFNIITTTLDNVLYTAHNSDWLQAASTLVFLVFVIAPRTRHRTHTHTRIHVRYWNDSNIIMTIMTTMTTTAMRMVIVVITTSILNWLSIQR